MSKEKRPRKLTEKEQRRVEKVNETTAQMQQNGFERNDVTISGLSANVMAFAWLIPFAVLFVWWYIAKNGTDFYFTLPAYFVFMILLILAIVAHELIHGLVWGLCAPGGFHSIEFGFIKEMCIPYCTCLEPLKKSDYILGSLMPGLVLGFIPSVVSVFSASPLLLFFGLLMISGAGGDLTIIVKMLAYKSQTKKVILLDHPTECGFIVFEKAENNETTAC